MLSSSLPTKVRHLQSQACKSMIPDGWYRDRKSQHYEGIGKEMTRYLMGWDPLGFSLRQPPWELAVVGRKFCLCTSCLSTLSGSKLSPQDTKLRQKEKLIWFYWWPTANLSKQILVQWEPQTHQSVRVAWTGLWNLYLCSLLWLSFLWQATLLDITTQNNSKKESDKKTAQWLYIGRSKPRVIIPKEQDEF